MQTHTKVKKYLIDILAIKTYGRFKEISRKDLLLFTSAANRFLYQVYTQNNQLAQKTKIPKMHDFERNSRPFALKCSPVLDPQKSVKFLVCHLPDVYFTDHTVKNQYCLI